MTVLDSVLASLTAEQRAAATSEKPATAVLAGPGSGKTFVLAARITWLVIEKRVRPSRILAFTFTKAAAAELRARLERVIGRDSADAVDVTTFHSWALRMLRLNPVSAGLQGEFSVASEEEIEGALDGMYDTKAGTVRPETKRCSRTALASAILDRDSSGQMPPVGPTRTLLEIFDYRLGLYGLVPVGAAPRLLAHAIHAEVAADKRAGGDGSDGSIVEACRAYEEVLVDEAHDATPIELTLTGCLGTPARLVYALDPRQAIYGWRGAAGANAAAFLGVDVEHRPLTKCFRFGFGIAKVVNGVAREIHARAPISAVTVGRVPLDVDPADVYAQVTERGTEALAEEVRLLSKVMGPENVAVLCRTNALCFDVQGALDGMGAMPRRLLDPLWLECADAVARLALNPNDDGAFTFLWRAEEDHCTWRGSLHALRAAAGRARHAFSQYRATFGDDAREDGSLLACAATIPMDARFASAAGAAMGNLETRGIDPEGRYAEASRLVDLELSLRDALDFLATRDEASGFEAVRAAGKVTVSTIHMAKGREWDGVVVATDDRWPWLALDDRYPDAAESLRVLYVALSRAKRELVILCPEGRSLGV